MITVLQAGCIELDERIRRLSGGQLSSAADCVSAADALYSRRKSRAVDRRRTLAGRAALRLVAAHQDGCVASCASQLPIRRPCLRCGQSHGRPELAGASLSSSRSEDHVLAAAAAAHQRIGADIEAFPPTLPTGFDAYVLHHRERAEMAAHPAPAHRGGERSERLVEGIRARVERWVLKEAVLKASGLGLEHSPHHLLLGRPGSVTTWYGRGGPAPLVWRPVLRAADPAVEGFCCAIPAGSGSAAAVAARSPDDITELGWAG